MVDTPPPPTQAASRMLAYRFVCGFLRLLIKVFFRQVEVVGLEHVPAEGEGPVIFAGNHPNSLIDPVLIVTNSGRIVHFAAKDVLFKSRLLRPFLAGLGVVPIARRKDHPDGPLDNTAAFEKLFAVLAAGRSIGIFPEGISHDAAHLARLKTGAARIAIGLARREKQLRIRIVPCGLVYVHRKRFRSRVLVQFGEPIELGAERRTYGEGDEREAVHALTDEIAVRLQALTVNADDWDTLRVLDGVRRLYQPPRIALQDRIELSRRFASVYATVSEEPAVVELYGRVKAYLERLEDAGLSDGEVRGVTARRPLWRKTLRNLWLILLWLPLAVPGAVLHAPLGLLAGWAGDRFAPRKDVTGSAKLLVGMILVAVGYVAVLVLVAWKLGWPWCLVAAGLLPLSGTATLRVLERSASLRRMAGRLLHSFTLVDKLEQLREERAALEAAVVEAVDRYRPADMVPLFPRSPTAPGDESP